MNLQSLSLSTASQTNNYAQAIKNNGDNNRSTANALRAPNSSFDKTIESIQEQIQKIQESEYYDPDTKLSKIEELEKQLQEIEKAKAEQLAESVLGQKKKSHENRSGNSEKNNINSESAVLDLSTDAQNIIKAESSLKNMQNARTMSIKLEGESNVLASEIKMDKGRGVDTAKKEEQLAKLKEGAENSFKNMGESVKDINNAVLDEIPEAPEDTDATAIL